MKRLILTQGLPASGKTTWAMEELKNQPTMKRVSRDDLRHMLFGDDYKFTRAREREVSHARDDIIHRSLNEGWSVIVDETGLNPKTVDRLRTLAKFGGATFVTKVFDTPVLECIERNRKRENPVPEKVIWRMYEQYLRHQLPEQDATLPRAIIVDIDGTLAVNVSGRSPYDWDRVGQDALDLSVYNVVLMYAEFDYEIFIMSGRDGVCRDQTVGWLTKYAVQYDHLLMREEGDQRKDSIVKRELFERHVQGKYYVELVLDDRKQVVDMWRHELGLTVWQVAEGNF